MLYLMVVMCLGLCEMLSACGYVSCRLVAIMVCDVMCVGV